MTTQTSMTHTGGGVTSTGGAADPLDLLARQAQAQENADLAEAGQALPGEAEAAAPEMGNAQCLVIVFEMTRGLLLSMAGVKSPARTLSDDKIAPASEALGAVLDKHGIQLAGVAGDYMLEIKAAALVLPMLWAFGSGLAQEIEADKLEQKRLKTEAATMPTVADAANDAGFVHVVG